MGFLLQHPPLLIDKKADSPRACASMSCSLSASSASTPWSLPPGAGEGEAAVPLDLATGRGRVPQGAREKPSYRWIRRRGGATCRRERGSSSSASARRHTLTRAREKPLGLIWMDSGPNLWGEAGSERDWIYEERELSGPVLHYASSMRSGIPKAGAQGIGGRQRHAGVRPRASFPVRDVASRRAT
jgi:hypothetical protein